MTASRLSPARLAATLETAERVLRDHGLRSTTARRLVLAQVLDEVRDAIRSAGGHEARFTHLPLVGLGAACAASVACTHSQTEHPHAGT